MKKLETLRQLNFDQQKYSLQFTMIFTSQESKQMICQRFWKILIYHISILKGHSKGSITTTISAYLNNQLISKCRRQKFQRPEYFIRPVSEREEIKVEVINFIDSAYKIKMTELGAIEQDYKACAPRTMFFNSIVSVLQGKSHSVFQLVRPRPQQLI